MDAIDMDVTKSSENSTKNSRIGTNELVDYLIGNKSSEHGALVGDIEDFERQIEIPEEIHQAIKMMYEDINSRTDINVALVEQARVVYLNSQTHKIETTEDTYGDKSEVNTLGLALNAVDKGLVVGGIHNHPKSSLFSVEDYAPVLLGNPDENVRVMRMQIVLCEGLQIMAISTKDTPILSNFEDLLKYVQEKNNFIDEIEQRLLDEYNIESVSFQNEDARLVNSELYKVAKELNVKLYFSQDMRTFKEFSA